MGAIGFFTPKPVVPPPPEPPSIPWTENFTGINNDPPNSDYWTITLGDPFINDNKLRGVVSNNVYDTIEFNWTLSGNFDISASSYYVSQLGGGAWLLRAEIDSTHRVTAWPEHRSTPDQYITEHVNGGGPTYYNSSGYTPPDNDARVRITRSGSNVQAWYWKGFWSGMGPAVGIGSDNISLILQMQRWEAGTYIRDLDWVTISAGTVVV